MKPLNILDIIEETLSPLSNTLPKETIQEYSHKVMINVVIWLREKQPKLPLKEEDVRDFLEQEYCRAYGIGKDYIVNEGKTFFTNASILLFQNLAVYIQAGEERGVKRAEEIADRRITELENNLQKSHRINSELEYKVEQLEKHINKNKWNQIGIISGCEMMLQTVDATQTHKMKSIAIENMLKTLNKMKRNIIDNDGKDEKFDDLPF